MRFDSIWASGYGEERAWRPPLLGLAVCCSPGRGLCRIFRAARRRRDAVIVAEKRAHDALRVRPGHAAAVYCRWHGWDGGWCWGPRFLVPTIAPLMLLCAPFFDGLWSGTAGTWRRAAVYVLLAASALISFTGTLVAYTDFDQALRHAGTTLPYLEVVRWSWRTYPPVAYWPFVPKEFYLLVRALRAPQAWWLAALFGAGLGLLPSLARHTGTLALGQSTRFRLSLGGWVLVGGLAVLFGTVARLSG